MILARTLASMALVCVCRSAHAQSGSEASAAAMLGSEGLRLFEQHDCVGALVKLDQAEAIAPNAVHGLRAAQCLEQLGRLVESEERYLRTSKLEATSDEQVAAQREAVRRRDAIVPRIAHLHLAITGKADAIVVDGRSVAAPAIAVDPGVHRVVVRGGGHEVRGEATMNEGEDRTVAFVLPTAPQPGGREIVVQRRHSAPTPSGFPFRTFGAVGLVAGGVAIGVGLATWGAALSESSTLDTLCPNRVCARSADVDARLSRYDALRSTSIVTLLSGIVLAGAGLTLVLVAPKRTQVTIGPSAVLFRWAF